MTKEEFSKFKFTANIRVIHKNIQGCIFDIASVDFSEDLIGLDDGDDIKWVRCENVELSSD